MKKRIFILLVLLLITVCAFAQAPEWLWAEKAGGSCEDFGNGISTDANGNVYVIGDFHETAIFGSFNLTSNGTKDIFVAKMNSNGQWLWAENAGGSHADFGNGISTDADGNVYVTGYFYSSTASFGPFNLTSNGELDIFVAKMDSNGNWLWAENAGGSYMDFGNGISTDADGNVYVTGYFGGIASFGPFNLTSNGDHDIFLAKIDSNGYWLWAEKAGGSYYDKAYGISTDADGNVYVTGCFGETASFGPFNLTSNGDYDIFVAKMDSNGYWLWAEKAGGSYHDEAYGISTDSYGAIYVTGFFCISANFGFFNLTSNADYDIFAAKMDTNGNWLWAENYGGFEFDLELGISTDPNGDVYVTGNFYGTATFGPFNLTSNGGNDIFVAKMDTNGNWLWAENYGGFEFDLELGISTDPNGDVYVTGNFYGTATFGPFNLTSNGGNDIFVAKMDSNGNWLWTENAGGIHCDFGNGISTDPNGDVYVTGYFQATASFGSFNLTSNGEYDIFVAKLNSSVSAENEIIPSEIGLSNYPNPFNPETTISFSFTAKDAKNAKIEIYNLKGQRIKQFSIFNSQSSILWDGKDENNQPVGSGIYFYKLTAGKFEESRKMILIK